MKITKQQLKQIIMEELQTLREEGYDKDRDERLMGMGRRMSWEDMRDKGWSDGMKGKDPDPQYMNSNIYMDSYREGRKESGKAGWSGNGPLAELINET